MQAGKFFDGSLYPFGALSPPIVAIIDTDPNRDLTLLLDQHHKRCIYPYPQSAQEPFQFPLLRPYMLPCRPL